jgi:hypothetical protein
VDAVIREEDDGVALVRQYVSLASSLTMHRQKSPRLFDANLIFSQAAKKADSQVPSNNPVSPVSGQLADQERRINHLIKQSQVFNEKLSKKMVKCTVGPKKRRYLNFKPINL